MVARFKKVLKNQKGLTLIELLAVVVILGIISAIAVPSIGGIIDNTKKDAHIANAQQMINAAKMAIASEKELLQEDLPLYLSLEYLLEEGYIEPMEDPNGDGYYDGTYDNTTTGKETDGSVVEIKKDTNNSYIYSVKLGTNTGHGITTLSEPNELNRDAVK